MKKILAATAGSALALAMTTMTAPPAQAAPVVTGGLVNVTITDIDIVDDVIVNVEDVNVSLGAALGIAANICDTNVNVLATQLRNGGATCSSETGDQVVDITQM